MKLQTLNRYRTNRYELFAVLTAPVRTKIKNGTTVDQEEREGRERTPHVNMTRPSD